MAGISGTVATYTVDRLAFSPSQPLTDAVVDFDGGGRYTLELAAKCEVCGKTSTVSIPVRILSAE